MDDDLDIPDDQLPDHGAADATYSDGADSGGDPAASPARGKRPAAADADADAGEDGAPAGKKPRAPPAARRFAVLAPSGELPTLVTVVTGKSARDLGLPKEIQVRNVHIPQVFKPPPAADGKKKVKTDMSLHDLEETGVTPAQVSYAEITLPSGEPYTLRWAHVALKDLGEKQQQVPKTWEDRRFGKASARVKKGAAGVSDKPLGARDLMPDMHVSADQLERVVTQRSEWKVEDKGAAGTHVNLGGLTAKGAAPLGPPPPPADPRAAAVSALRKALDAGVRFVDIVTDAAPPHMRPFLQRVAAAAERDGKGGLRQNGFQPESHFMTKVQAVENAADLSDFSNKLYAKIKPLSDPASDAHKASVAKLDASFRAIVSMLAHYS